MAWLPGALLNISPAPGIRHAFLPVIISRAWPFLTGMAGYPFGGALVACPARDASK
jgi:hypothetical protein